MAISCTRNRLWKRPSDACGDLRRPRGSRGQPWDSRAGRDRRAARDAVGAHYLTARPDGLAGPIRLVAQVQQHDNVRLKPVKFYIDDALFGEAESGPPFALEWVDENPFEAREIVAEACDETGECVRDRVLLKPSRFSNRARYPACYSKHPYRTRPVVTSAG